MAINSWRDAGNWNNPDPTNWKYLVAIFKAIRERESLLRFFYPARRNIPSTSLYCAAEKMPCLYDYAVQIVKAINELSREERRSGENLSDYSGYFIDLSHGIAAEKVKVDREPSEPYETVEWTIDYCTQSYLTSSNNRLYTALPPRGCMPEEFIPFLKRARAALDAMQGVELKRVFVQSETYRSSAVGREVEGDTIGEVVGTAYDNYQHHSSMEDLSLYFFAEAERYLPRIGEYEDYSSRFEGEYNWQITYSLQDFEPELFVAVFNPWYDVWDKESGIWKKGARPIRMFGCDIDRLSIFSPAANREGHNLIWRVFEDQQIPSPPIPTKPSKDSDEHEVYDGWRSSSRLRFSPSWRCFLNFSRPGGFNFRADS